VAKPRKKRRWFGLRPAPSAPPPDPRRFDEAVDFFRNRVPMPKAEWLKLGTAARQRGFTVADVAQLDVIHQVWLALDDAIARGSTFEDFKATVSETLSDEWQGSVTNPPARVETIFRTNVMTANNAGRHAQMTDPVVLDRRPFWQYIDIDDQRECPICNSAHGTILPSTDPWWQTAYPPRHFQCVPGDTIVEGAFTGALRARYSGKMIEIETHAGRRLRITPNHPVLTTAGFVPAGAVRHGDDLMCQPRVIDGSTVSAGEYGEHNGPSEIEQVFSALREQRGFLRSTRMGPLDFYGDAERFNGDVEVVGSYGKLVDRVESERAQSIADLRFVATHAGGSLPVGASDGEFCRHGLLRSRGGLPSSGALTLDSAGDDLNGGPLDPLRFGPSADVDSSLDESVSETRTRDALFVGDLLHRFPSDVSTDKVVKVGRYDFSGHVFDLQSIGGWIVASGIYISNCRCRVRPLTEKQAADMGITRAPSTIPSDEGFGSPPTAHEPFVPDLSKYPPELAAIAREKMGATP